MNSSKPQRPVVQRAGQPESVFHQRRLPRLVALIHPADLRDGRVALIHHEQKIVRKKIQQRVGRRARRASGEMAAVVLDPLAESHLPHHFQIVFRALPDALRFEQLALLLEPCHALVQPRPGSCVIAPLHLVARGHELLRRIKRVALEPARCVSPVSGSNMGCGRSRRRRIRRARLVLPATPDRLRRRRRARGISRAESRCRCARRACPTSRARKVLAVHPHAFLRPAPSCPVVLRRTQAVDARHARHHDAHPRASAARPSCRAAAARSPH